jgi:hypothetical protein
MLVASYTSGLAGTPGIQVRFRLPSTMEEAVRIALVVEQSELQDRKGNAFFLNKDDQQSIDAGSPSRGSRVRNRGRFDTRQHRVEPSSRSCKESADGEEIRRYECDGRAHMARECPTRRNRQQHRNPR